MINISNKIIGLLLLTHINTSLGFNMFTNRRNIIKNSVLLSNYNPTLLLPENENENENENEKKLIIDTAENYIKKNRESSNNNIFFTGSLTEETCFKLSAALIEHKNQALINDKYPNHINLYIQSPGGSLLPTLALVDEIKNLEIPVYTHIRGYAASAATLLSVVGAKRLIYNNSVMMIHGIKFSEENSVTNLLETKDLNDNVDLFMSIIKNIYLENSNIDEDTLNHMFYHDKWIGSKQALDYGLVDEII